MKSALKFAFTSLGLLLIAVGIGSVVFVSQAERFVTKSIAEIMTDTFESAAHLDHITVSPARRELILHDFSLDNPKGFKEGQALVSDRIILKVDPFSLLSDTPIIEVMTLLDTKIQYRLEIPNGTNIGVLANHLEERSKQEGGRKFVIQKLVCRGAAIEFTTHLLPKNLDLNLVNIELDDLQGETPITTGELASIFLRSIIKETLTLKGILSPIINQLKRETSDDEENMIDALEEL